MEHRCIHRCRNSILIVSRSLPLISVSSYAISRHNLPLGIPFRDQELADQHARVTGARARGGNNNDRIHREDHMENIAWFVGVVG